ncbi:MAG: helix-turn-helix domain-containing protein [Fibromonadales bacterium]|nr:helix-turn-helix domain-containing protein [Fibromonadales bacterium]
MYIIGVYKVTLKNSVKKDVPVFYLDLTRRLFPELIEEFNADKVADDIATDIRDWDWFKEKTANITPGKNLRTVREMRSMKQKELADKLGIKARQISDMENGRAPIGKKMAMRLGKTLNMDYRHFL